MNILRLKALRHLLANKMSSLRQKFLDISWETKWLFWEFWHLFQQTICPLKNYALRHIVYRNKFLKILSLWYLILDGNCRSLWIFGQLLLIGNYLLEKMWNGTQLHYQWSEQPTKNLSKDQRNLQWPPETKY